MTWQKQRQHPAHTQTAQVVCPFVVSAVVAICVAVVAIVALLLLLRLRLVERFVIVPAARLLACQTTTPAASRVLFAPLSGFLSFCR